MGTPAWSEADDEEFRSYSGELGILDDAWLKRLGVNTEAPKNDHHGLDPTDIYHVARDLFGLAIRPAEYPDRPDILTVYTRETSEIALDWSLFFDSYASVSSESSWHRILASSRAARFLIGWCCATHLVGEVESLLRIGLVPRTKGFSHAELHRLANTWQMLADLFCPEERLVEQAGALGIPNHVLLRANWRERTQVFMPPPTLVGILAQRNHCLPLIIELQLDRSSGLPLLAHLFTRLMLEAPIFQLRAMKAGKLFAKTAELGTRFVDVRFSL